MTALVAQEPVRIKIGLCILNQQNSNGNSSHLLSVKKARTAAMQKNDRIIEIT